MYGNDTNREEEVLHCAIGVQISQYFIDLQIKMGGNIVLSRYILSIALFFTFTFPMKRVQAESFYSLASLTLLCADVNPSMDFPCTTYVHGVVETWFVKDLAGFDPPQFVSRPNTPIFCDTILKVSDKEWVKIVRDNLNSMRPGFASDAVIDVLHKKLCR